ncbi:MAG: FG-GAP repeat domain-containing protein, partial [Gemmatimonadales bacterium]
TTNYTKRTCLELSQVPGQLKFLGGQGIPAPVASPYEVQMGDVNGDGRTDLIWNYRSPGANDVAVSLASATGVFGTPDTYANSQPAPSEGWGNYDLHVGDVTGDGLADLVWNYRGTAANKIYVARALAAGGFTFDPVDSLSSLNWSAFKIQLGDVTGDGADDIVWNALTSINSTYVGTSNKDGTFTLGGPYVHPNGGWSTYQMLMTDLNKDGREDLVWSNVPGGDQPNRTYTGLSLASGGFQFSGPKDHSTTCCWSGYVPLVADFNGDQIGDIHWNRISNTYIHRFRGNGAGGWNQLGGVSIGSAASGFTPMTGDLNGDGRADMIWTTLGTDSARVRIALSDPNGVPNVSPVGQSVPAIASFNLGKVFVGRVDSDTRDDLVWVIPEATTSIYVGVALP